MAEGTKIAELPSSKMASAGRSRRYSGSTNRMRSNPTTPAAFALVAEEISASSAEVSIILGVQKKNRVVLEDESSERPNKPPIRGKSER